MNRRTAWRLVRQAPGPWLLLAGLAGWVLLAVHALDAVPATAHHRHHGGTHHAGVGAWLAMLLAMAPLVLRSEIAFLLQGNLRRRRLSAILAFLAGYALPWIALGLASAWLLAGHPLSTSAALSALVAVVAWHCAPLRQRCLNLCHRLPRLRAFGSGMLVDTARFGLRTGVLCCAICGPGMLFAMSLPAYHLAAMLAVTAIATAERYMPVRRPAWQLPRLLKPSEPQWRSLAVPLPPVVETA